MANRAADWFKQAQRDLEHAEDSRRAGRHEWACFAAQQSAEKAIKGLHLHLGQQAWGHVIGALIEELPEEHRPSNDTIERARVLDTCYMPALDPNAPAQGVPFEHYGPPQSEEAIRCAGEIVTFVRLKAE